MAAETSGHRPAGPVAEAVRGRRSYRYVALVAGLGFSAWTLVSMDTTMPGLALPQLSKSLHLSLPVLEYLLGVFSFVSFAFPVVAGRFVDRLGRRIAFQGSLLGTGIFSGLTAAVGAAWQFVVVRVLASTSFGLVEPAVNTMMVEEAPARLRGVLMGFVQAGYPLGAAISGFIAAALLPGPGWRPLFLVAFAPVLLLLVTSACLRESSRFEGVRSTVERLRIEHRPGWRSLFTAGRTRQTVVTSLFGFCINGGIGLVIGVVTTYLVHVDHLALGAAAFLFGLSNWAALVSQLLVGWLADRVPAKWLMVAYSVIAAGFMAMLAIPGLTYETAAVSLVGFGFFGNGTFGCYPRYTTESYPTEVRGTGTSFSLGFSFLTLAFMPVIGGALIDSAVPRVIPVISAAIVLAGAVVMSFGRNLPPRRELEVLAPSLLGREAGRHAAGAGEGT